jgi:hypothetical protein
MVLASFGPSVVVDPNGPNQQSGPGLASVPTDQGGTVLENFVSGELDSTIELQAPAPQKNPFEELNLFIGELSRIYQLAPRATMVRIQDMLQAMLTQSYA